MHVVEVQGNRVVGLFPFDGERQSMLFVDTLLLSDRILPIETSDIAVVTPDDVPEIHRAVLYAVEKRNDVYMLKSLLSNE